MIGTLARAAWVILAIAAVAEARSLADDLHRFVEQNTSIFTIGGVADFVTPSIERLAIRGIDFPATATAPGFTYRFDFESSSFVRDTTSVGPVYTERPETIGARRFEVGMSVLYGALDEVDGGGFGTVSSGLFQVEVDGEPLDVVTALNFDDFTLRTTVVAFAATYGLSDRWDVNVYLPLVNTELDIDATRAGIVADTAGNVVASDRARVGLEADAFGVGDLMFRTKYRIGEWSLAHLALGLAIRCPTGSTEDFHGLGDWTVTPQVIVGRELGRLHPTASLGFELNAGDLERTRVRYAAGVAAPIWRGLGAFAELLGSSGVADDEFTLSSLFPAVLPPPNGVKIVSTRRTGSTTTVTAAIPRSDVVDLALGFKFAAFGRLMAFAGAIVPLTDDGLRADVLPVGGVQVGF